MLKVNDACSAFTYRQNDITSWLTRTIFLGTLFNTRCAKTVAWSRQRTDQDQDTTEPLFPIELKVCLYEAVCSLRLEGFDGYQFRSGMSRV